jgi:hypothetical protein
MPWIVEYTDEFFGWWRTLPDRRQDAILRGIRLIEARGPHLPFPHSSAVFGSRHDHMRELRIQSQGEPLRVFYAFDPRRTAILLIGGNKAGDDRFYDRMVPLADELYDVHLNELHREGLLP